MFFSILGRIWSRIRIQIHIKMKRIRNTVSYSDRLWILSFSCPKMNYYALYEVIIKVNFQRWNLSIFNQISHDIAGFFATRIRIQIIDTDPDPGGQNDTYQKPHHW